MVTVQDSSGDTLQPLTSHVVSNVLSSNMTSSHLGFQPVSYGGRRLQGDSVAVPTADLAIPTAGPAQATQASVSALGRQDNGSESCAGFSWDLSLEPGQNDFSITTMLNGQPVSCQLPVLILGCSVKLALLTAAR